MPSSVLDVKDFAAVGDGITYDDDRFDAALRAIHALSPPSASRGAVLHIPHGVYRLRRSIVIHRQMVIQGVGLAGTILMFDRDVDGLVVGLGAQGDGSWSVIRDLALVSDTSFSFSKAPNPPINEDQPLTADPARSGVPRVAGSGIVLFARARIQNCRIAGFHYDGVHVEATDPSKNANNWEVHNCRVEGNGRHGLFLAGANANVGCVVQLDCSGNAGWAIYDRSQHGNTYLACHAEANGHFATDVRAIVPHPDDAAVVYAGTADGGVFRSSDSGETWSACNLGLAIDAADSRNRVASALAVVVASAGHPLVGSGGYYTLVYAGTETGVLISQEDPWNSDFNGGLLSWKRPAAPGTVPATPLTKPVRALIVAPASSLILYAGTEQDGVYRSVDAGQNWDPASRGLTSVEIRALAAVPGATQVLLAGTNGGGVFRSTDGGNSWSEANSGIPSAVRGIQALAVAGPEPFTVFAGTVGSGVFRSTDGGGTWQAVGPSDLDILVLAASPTAAGPIYAGSRGNGVWRSVDGGATWAEMNDGLGAPLRSIQALAAHPAEPDIAYLGLDGGGVFSGINPGGVFATSGTGDAWSARPNTFYGGAFRASGAHADSLFAGCYSEGAFINGSEIRSPSLVVGGLRGGGLSKVTTAGVLDSAGLTGVPFRGRLIHAVRSIESGKPGHQVNVSVDDSHILVDASGGLMQLLLPDPATVAGQIYVIKKVDTTPDAAVDVRIATDTAWQYVLTRPGETVTLVAVLLRGQADYKVISHYLPSAEQPDPVATPR